MEKYGKTVLPFRSNSKAQAELFNDETVVDGGVTLSSPEVSVVMSVYNGAKYLSESVESILEQKGVDFEFIIVNDGSTDDSGNILAEYAARDNRIRIIEQENIGFFKY